MQLRQSLVSDESGGEGDVYGGLGGWGAGRGGQEGTGEEAGGKEAEVKWVFKGNWEVEVLD